MTLTKVTSGVLDDDALNDKTVPVSTSGEPGLHFGAETSGETGFGIHTGTENILRGYAQDKDSLHISNGAVSSFSFNSYGDITIADDAVHQLDLDDAAVLFDQQGVMLISTNGTSTAALIQYRVTAGSAGEINIMSQAGTNVEVTASNTAPTGTTGTDGKFTVYVNKTENSVYFENRRGSSHTLSVTFFGHGGGMNK